jgi:hypothetical protein
VQLQLFFYLLRSESKQIWILFTSYSHHLFTSYTVKKSLFVLASRQKIPILRTENPAVDTRTICLLPIEFFKITHARKATAGKSRPETTDTDGKSRPSGVKKGKARKSWQVTTDTAGKFGCQ